MELQMLSCIGEVLEDENGAEVSGAVISSRGKKGDKLFLWILDRKKEETVKRIG